MLASPDKPPIRPGRPGHGPSRRGFLGRVLLAAPALAMASTAEAQASLVEIGVDGWLFPAWDSVNRLDQVALRQSLQTLTEAVGIIRSGRMDVVFCLIPSKKRLMRQFRAAGAPFSPEVERRYSQSMTELRRVGALVPDLDARFREVLTREPGRQLYFKTDTHWTPVGAEVAAIEIARQMREQLGMPPSPRPGTQLGALRSMTLAAGDLTQFLPTAERSRFGPEQSLIREILPPPGAVALLEDDTNDTVIVGTSNMQPRMGFQPVLSNQLLRPVGLLWRTNNVGPYETLLEYLRSGPFRQSRPRALVWNLLEQDMPNPTNGSAWGQRAMPPATFLTELRRLVSA